MTEPHKKLILNILNYYKEKENSVLNKTYKYYANTEFDSNVTDFEALSNGNRLLLYTCLNPTDVFLLVQIFRSIYDNNYYYFKEIDGLCDYDTDVINNTDKEILNPKNFRLFLDTYATNHNDLQIKEGFDKYGEYGRIEDIAVYNSKPNIAKEFDRINKKKNLPQKVYTIKDLIKSLNS